MSLVSTYTFSALGLINGIFGVDHNNWGYIAAIYEVVCQDHGVRIGSVGEKCLYDGCSKELILGDLIKFEAFERKKNDQND